MDNFPGGIRLTHIEFSDIICVMNQMMSVLGSLITNARYGLRTTFVVLFLCLQLGVLDERTIFA